jgi:hypothetical protein
MDEQQPQTQQEKKPELRRPDDAVKDLEPDEEAAEAVKGGITIMKTTDSSCPN